MERTDTKFMDRLPVEHFGAYINPLCTALFLGNIDM